MSGNIAKVFYEHLVFCQIVIISLKPKFYSDKLELAE
jgi:hypothetical protein